METTEVNWLYVSTSLLMFYNSHFLKWEQTSKKGNKQKKSWRKTKLLWHFKFNIPERQEIYNCFVSCPVAHLKSVLMSPISRWTTTPASLRSLFGMLSYLLNSLDDLFSLCRNSSTWKGVRNDLSLLVNTSLFAFGIWRQQNKTKPSLTECLPSNYCLVLSLADCPPACLWNI